MGRVLLNTMPTVKVLYEDEYEFDINAETIGDLKEELEEEMDLDVSKWNLFQFGLPLPGDVDAKLEDFLIEDEQLKLHLVTPEEPPRNDKKPIKFKTNKSRFIVKGTRDAFEILEIKPQKITPLKLKKSYFFSKKQRFGIVTHILNADNPGERKIQFDVYDVSKDGYVLIETDEDSNDDVFLVEGEPTTENRVKLEPTDTKCYDEKHIITPLQRKHLRTGYIEALFTGITGAAAVGSTALGGGS